jgi:hypothetical protein
MSEITSLFVVSLEVLGLVFAVIMLGYIYKFLSLVLKEKEMTMAFSQFQFNILATQQFSSKPSSSKAQSELKQRIMESFDHPEVAEIDESDKLMGVVLTPQNYTGVSFPGATYPPTFERDEDEEFEDI